ncbi:MAG: gluconate 2-dehydrogenase subunit 3 family protein [Acidobacteria bacterium]|nr:gluconate 2-dehydrogenase subunit 3 family protein [Acidobacteriota bacterium]
MNRRDLFRSTLLGGGLLALRSTAEGQAVTPGQVADSRVHPHEKPPDLTSPDWKPVFFDAHQNETLIALSDRILPETNTPGAKAAQANRFLDLVLSAEEPGTQREFLSGLSYIDGESQSRYRQPFVDLPMELQDELIAFLAFERGPGRWTGEGPEEFAGHRHFENLKGWISWAFYSSEIGMRALGWNGNMIAGEFTGCPHPSAEHGREQ